MANNNGNAVDDDLHNVKLDSLQFIHPSTPKRLLNDTKFSHPTTLARKNANEVSNNTLFNCTFYGSDGHPLVHAAGSGMLFENNLIEWTDWSAVTTRPLAFFDPDMYNFLWGTYGSGSMTFGDLGEAALGVIAPDSCHLLPLL